MIYLKAYIRKNTIYLLPYIFLIAIGIWYRMHVPMYAFLDGDSSSYLQSPLCRQLTGEWHKGYRPMQYLYFVYITLSKSYELNFTVIAQHVLSIAGALFLAGAWFVYVSHLTRRRPILFHLVGCLMLGIYVSSPILMYYSSMIGPESVSMFLMCTLIFFLSGVYAADFPPYVRASFLTGAIFINLYLANPMPKCIFSTIFLAVVLIWTTIKKSQLSKRLKITTLIIPHVLFILIVSIPEYLHKVDVASDDRVYIEFQQMAYTHFDLLARDKSNFDLPARLEDSLMVCFKNEKTESLIGFNSDNLMWGTAGTLINDHFANNCDSIGAYYRGLSHKLLTRYPLALYKEISSQIIAFYYPNKIIHKDLFGDQDIHHLYEMAKLNALPADSDFWDVVNYKCTNKSYKPIRFNVISSQYPESIARIGISHFSQLPLLFNQDFCMYTYFDYIFLFTMIAFFIVRFRRNKIFELDLVTLLYIYIVIYVTTIAIVHTFDVTRFITTIYPFILITTFFAFVYLCNEVIIEIPRIRKHKGE